MTFEVTPMEFGTVAPTTCGFLTYYPLVRDFWYPTVVEPLFPGQEPVTVHSRFDGYFTPEGKVYLTERMSDSEKLFSDAELAAEFYYAASEFQSANSMHLLFEDDETEQKLNDARDWMSTMERFAVSEHYWEEEEREQDARRLRIRENYKNYKKEMGYEE